MSDTNKSDIARIKSQIAMEYEATQQLFTGFTSTARHDFITKRQENIGLYCQELMQYIPEQEAIAMLVEAMDAIQSPLSSSGNTS
jgi:hypothetical protein